MKFSIAQLEAFDKICRLGTFHAAAEALHVTQPTITLRIRELEDALGVKLFVRRGRSVKLSPEGALVAQYVSQGLGLLGEMESQLRTGDPLQGSLRLGTPDMLAITCLPQIVQILEAAHPRLKVELTVTTSVALAELLNANRLDMALLSGPPSGLLIESEPLALADVAWVGSSSKAINGGFLRPHDLEGAKVLTVPPPSTLNDLIHDWCSSSRTPMPAVSTCNSIAIIARLVVAGVALSVLPVCVVQPEINAGAIIRYRQKDEFRPLTVCAAYRKAIRSSSIDSVLRVVRTVMTNSGYFTMLPYMDIVVQRQMESLSYIPPQ